MKKILAIAAVAALTAGVSAYAANPFSDVTPDDWAYQAVVDLSEQGVVVGYPDGTFRGERNIGADLLIQTNKYHKKSNRTLILIMQPLELR